LTVTNLPTTDITSVSVQIHPQKPEMGFRVMRQYHHILVDQADAATFAEGEEVTFLRWGNFFIDKVEKNAAGLVTAMTGRHHPEATNFSKTKKATWVADVPDLVECTLVEYGHLINKAKLDENDNFQDFVNPNTKSESTAWCDPLLRTVQQGQVIQLERKGFFRCDKPYAAGSSAPNAAAVVLIAIPDGKQAKGAAPAPQPVGKKGGKK
jgi:glutamyl-tRNA synthetase